MTSSRTESPSPTSGAAWSRWRRRIARVAVLSLLTLLFVEGTLRAYVAFRGWTPNCYAAHLDLLRPHPVNGYDLRPDFELRSGVFEMTTNSLGLRGPGIASRKPPGVVRVAVLGGSSAFGYLVSDGKEAARHLERELNAAGCNVEVINAGAPGYNLNQTLVRYREVVAPLNPDVVVLYAGHNDLGYFCSDEPDSARWRKLYVAPAWERVLGRSTLYGFLAYRLLQRGSTPPVGAVIAGEVTPAGVRQFEANLTEYLITVRDSGAQPVICAQATAARPAVDANLRLRLGATNDEIDRAIAVSSRMQETLRRVADEHDALFLNAGTEIPPTQEFLGDEIHLTAAGEERLSRVLARGLKSLMPNCRVEPGDSDASTEVMLNASQ